MRRFTALLLGALLMGSALFAFASTRRWAKYEYELQSPMDDPPDANQETEFVLARLRYRSTRDRPRYRSWGIDGSTSDRHFLTGLRRLTRVNARSIEQIVDVGSDDVFDWPWIYISTGGDWILEPSESERLKKYLDRGGFLVVDDFHGDDHWDQFIAGIEQAYPNPSIEEPDDNHPLFHTVYDLSHRLQVPGYQIVTRGEMWERNNGIQPYWRIVSDSKGRAQIGTFLNQDLGDAWEFSNDPAYPEQFASMAYRMGVNYVVYAMTH